MDEFFHEGGSIKKINNSSIIAFSTSLDKEKIKWYYSRFFVPPIRGSRRRTQVVREQSAKLRFVSSILTAAFRSIDTHFTEDI